MKLKRIAYALPFILSTCTYAQNLVAVIQFTEGEISTEAPSQTEPTGNIFKTIESATGYSIALDYTGTVWSSGNNNKGQLGVGDKRKKTSWQNTGLTNISKISANSYAHALALGENGDLWGVGYNTMSQLGILGDSINKTNWTKLSLSKIVEISAVGDDFSLALDSSGNVWVTGANDDGQLGLGHNNNITTWQKTPISDIVAIRAGGYHSFVLDSSNNLWATGKNNKGQLGLGNTNNVNSWTLSATNVKSINSVHYNSSYIDSNDDLWFAGDNYNGQSGLSHKNNVLTWEKVPLSVKVKEFKFGRVFSGFVDYNDDLWFSGDHSSGAFGDESKTSSNVFFKSSVSNVNFFSAGDYFSFYQDKDFITYGTGDNYYGNLGLGDTNQRNVYTETKAP